MYPQNRHQCRPEDHIQDYLISIRDPEVQRRHWPLLDYPVLIRDKCRRELRIVEEELDAKRQYCARKRKEFNRQWLEIEKEGLTLKKNFSAFNGFLQVNLAKRERAEENKQSYEKVRGKTEEAVQDLVEKLESLKQSKIALDKEIASHKMYQQYLSRVVEKCSKEDGIKNESSLVQCFEYYNELSQVLAQQSDSLFVQLQAAKTKMHKFVNVAEQLLLSLSTQAADLQGRYEESIRKSLNLEYWVSKIRTHIQYRLNEVYLVKSSTWNIFTITSRRKGIVSKVAKHDIERQLVHIKRTLLLLATIHETLAPKKVKSKRKLPIDK